jgi:ribosomal protein RSM22 (predicted rRNA methylase)
MKLLKFLLPVALVFCFTGCLDINESVDIRNDGSGQLTMDVDLSQMLDMLQTYMGKDELAKKGIQKMDTTILLKDLIDTVSTLSADKKAILRPGRVHIKLDMDAKVFTVHSMFPFTSVANLQKLYALKNDGSLGNAKLLGALGGDAGGQGGPGAGDFDQFNNIFDFTCKDGLLSKKLNKEKFEALKNNPELAQVKQASQMGMEINYITTLSVPRPVKKVTNPLAKLSDDKKTVTIKFNLIDVFEHPEQFEYTVEY